MFTLNDKLIHSSKQNFICRSVITQATQKLIASLDFDEKGGFKILATPEMTFKVAISGVETDSNSNYYF